MSTSVVRWNGANRTTTFVNSTQLRATIPASDRAALGPRQVTVFTPAPGGGALGAADVHDHARAEPERQAPQRAGSATSVTATLINGNGGYAGLDRAGIDERGQHSQYLQYIYVGHRSHDQDVDRDDADDARHV